MKDSIKRAQSRAGSGFAERENFRPKVKQQKTKQLIMTLVALLALTTHAWATDPTVYDSGEVELSSLQVGDILMPGVTVTKGNNSVYGYLDYDRFSKDGVIQKTRWKISSNPFSIGLNGLINAQLAGSGPYNCMPITEDSKAGNAWVVTSISGSDIRIGGTIYPKPTPFAITWSAETPNTASIDKMPAGNVTVNVDYFAQAEFAKSNDPTPVALAPAAIPNVPANTDAPIVTAGTVANIGTSEVPQGTLKYFVKQADGNTAPTAPDYDDDGWDENVPTANELKQGDVYVWYYIKGAEPDNITDRTDANTRSDSDIMPLGANGIVTLEAEPTYDVTLNAEGLSDEEAAAWKVAKGTDQPAAFPLEGVKKSETVTVTYSGDRKVIGVKAEKKAAEPASTPLDNTTTAWTAGTYVVPAGGLTYSDAITVSGDVTLTLTDGEMLTLNKGISLAEGATLTIQGNGTMNVNGTDGNTSSTVGGNHGTLILTSGTLTATGGNGGSVGEYSAFESQGGNGGDAINGSVIVSGGTLTARGGNGGSVGDWTDGCSGGNGGDAISGTLTINGGSTSVNDGSNGSTGSIECYSSAGTGGKAVAGTVTDNRN